MLSFIILLSPTPLSFSFLAVNSLKDSLDCWLMCAPTLRPYFFPLQSFASPSASFSLSICSFKFAPFPIQPSPTLPRFGEDLLLGLRDFKIPLPVSLLFNFRG
jgi:hypothetical protein